MSERDHHDSHRKKEHGEHSEKGDSHKGGRDALNHEKAQHEREIKHVREKHDLVDKRSHKSVEQEHAHKGNDRHADHRSITETVRDKNNRVTDRFIYADNDNLKLHRATMHEHVSYSQNKDGSRSKEEHEIFDLTKPGPAVKISTTVREVDHKTGEVTHDTDLPNGEKHHVKLAKDGHPIEVSFSKGEKLQFRFHLKNGIAYDVDGESGAIGASIERKNLLNTANISIAEAKHLERESSALERSPASAHTDVSMLTGTLTAFGQRGEKYQLVSGKIFDSSKQLLGSLDENGMVHFADHSKGSEQPMTSVFNNHFDFHGEQNGVRRTIRSSDDYKLTEGKLFLPENGKSHEYAVKLGMILDKSTGEQIGSIAPPVVHEDKMLAGKVLFNNGKEVDLSTLSGAVFDLKVVDNMGRSMHESSIQGASIGAIRGASGDISAGGGYLNIAAALRQQQQVVESSEADKVETQNSLNSMNKAASVLGVLSPLAAIAANKVGLTDVSQSMSDRIATENKTQLFHANQIVDLQTLLNTGRLDKDRAQNLGLRFENVPYADIATDNSGPQKGDESSRPRIKVPTISESNVDAVQGRMRLGNQVYEIKNGVLFEKSTANGHDGKTEAGYLKPNYEVTFKNGTTVSLADQYRVMMDITIGDSHSHHQIIGLGPARNTDSFGFNTGGLCDRKELYSQALDAQKEAAASNADYFDKRSYATGWIANAGGGDYEGAMRQLEQCIETDTRHFKQNMDTLFVDGFETKKINNNQLDGHLDVAQLMLKNMGATASDTSSIAQEGRQVQQMTNDSLVIAGTTVATAGIGAAPGLAATLAKGGTMVRIGVTAAEVATGSLAGGGISYVGRMSNSSDDGANFKAGLIEGASMSASSAGFKLMGNVKMLGQARALAEDLRSEKVAMSTLSTEQLTLMNSGIGKMALAGKGETFVRTVSTGHLVADAALQSTAFGTASKIRDHDNHQLTAQEIAIGTGAMMFGHYLKAATVNGAAKLGMSETSAASAAMSDMASAYGNGCAGQATAAQQHERERVARLMKLSPDMVPMEALNYANILHEVHNAGLMSAMSAPFMTVGTRSMMTLSEAASNPKLLIQRLSSAADRATATSSINTDASHGFEVAKELISQHETLTPKILSDTADQLREQARIYAAQQHDVTATTLEHAANIVASDLRVFNGEHYIDNLAAAGSNTDAHSPRPLSEHELASLMNRLDIGAQEDNPVLKQLQKSRKLSADSDAKLIPGPEQAQPKIEKVYSDQIPEPKDPPGYSKPGDREIFEQYLTPKALLTEEFEGQMLKRLTSLETYVETEDNWHKLFLAGSDLNGETRIVAHAKLTRKGETGDDSKTFLVENLIIRDPFKQTDDHQEDGLGANEFKKMQVAVMVAILNAGGDAIETGGANNYRVGRLYRLGGFAPCEQTAKNHENVERYLRFYNSKAIPLEYKLAAKSGPRAGFESILGSMTHLNNEPQDRIAWDRYRRAQNSKEAPPDDAHIINYETKDGTVVSAFAYKRSDGTPHLSFLKGSHTEKLEQRELFEWSYEEVAGNLRMRQQIRED